ncbi:MAG TPA: hypothetical protein VGI32_08780 [Steroidobacteraceae bacterium]
MIKRETQFIVAASARSGKKIEVDNPWMFSHEIDLGIGTLQSTMGSLEGMYLNEEKKQR